MKIQFKCIGFALGIAVGTAAARDGSSGYLATVGPATLRFQRPSLSVPALPPLDSGEKSSVELISKPAEFHRDGQQVQPRSSLADKAGPVRSDNLDGTTNSPERLGNLGGFPAGGEFALDPAINTQMILRFFAQGTNRSEASVVLLPVSFTPAQPAARLSSSAQYTSNKP